MALEEPRRHKITEKFVYKCKYASAVVTILPDRFCNWLLAEVVITSL